MTVEIRRAALDDADVIGGITARSWQAAYRGIIPERYLAKVTPEFRARKYQEIYPLLKDVEFYLVYADGEPVGAFNLHAGMTDDTKDCGEIGIFYFLPEHWGRGHGSTAMDFALERLRQLGFRQAVLWVLEENGRARRFYEKRGFVPDGGRKTIDLGRELADIRYRRLL